jgi:hypothetical protein
MKWSSSRLGSAPQDFEGEAAGVALRSERLADPNRIALGSQAV